jgi:hypothetical protein
MNTAVIEEDADLYLGDVLIKSGWFANSARIADKDGVITVWPQGGIGWPPEPPERWTIVDVPKNKKEPTRSVRQKVAIAIVRRKYPNGVPLPADIAELTRLIRAQWEKECKRQGVVGRIDPLERDAVAYTLRKAGLIP